MGPVRIGIHTGLQHVSFADVQALWRDAEAAGIDWISVWDHFYPAAVGDVDGPNLEAVSCHAALAASTSRARVGCLVYSAGYRHPAVLANAAATIDHISEGRLEFGIGAGWLQTEYDAYGIPFESPGTRIRRLDEAVQVIRSLWTEPATDFDGEFYTLRGARCEPKPVQSPARIWIGGSGKSKMLPLVGRRADGWNAPFQAPESWAQQWDVVREHASAAGRDPDTIAAAVNLGLALGPDDSAVERKRGDLPAQYGPIAGFLEPGILVCTPDEAVERCSTYIDAGADWLVFAMRPPFDREAFDLLVDEVLPHLPRATEPGSGGT
ncbi:MAG: TIGR03560 family F420-dependent LLM class oxidoreductase [Acidimicrobiia bacterium]|nr:TIGR03560 family F420-dependent LLM class oxidoreductase [Acidimicrobiia bacterium]